MTRVTPVVTNLRWQKRRKPSGNETWHIYIYCKKSENKVAIPAPLAPKEGIIFGIPKTKTIAITIYYNIQYHTVICVSYMNMNLCCCPLPDLTLLEYRWLYHFCYPARYIMLYYLVGGFNPSEKYESQIGPSSQLLGKISHVPNHQPVMFEIN